MWPIEEIPDEDRLFMRVHFENIVDGEPGPGAFRDHGGGMSTDWEKYSTPEESQGRAQRPELYGVISLVTGEVRSIPSLTVVHEPLDDNRAHTEVFGEKRRDPEVRVKLTRMSQWEICYTALP